MTMIRQDVSERDKDLYDFVISYKMHGTYDLYEKVYNWLGESCPRFTWGIDNNNGINVFFQNEEDAVLFKLVWS